MFQFAQIVRTVHCVGTFERRTRFARLQIAKIARECAVPSGSALAVDRQKFSEAVEKALFAYDNFTLVREEVKTLDDERPTIVATGPLTSDVLAEQVGKITGKDRLYFMTLSHPLWNLTA